MNVQMAPELIPPFSTARFALLGPIAPHSDDGDCEWRVIIRCHDGERPTFHRVAMGVAPMGVTEQKQKQAEALFRSSGYKIKRCPMPMESWTATWGCDCRPWPGLGTGLAQKSPTDCTHYGPCQETTVASHIPGAAYVNRI